MLDNPSVFFWGAMLSVVGMVYFGYGKSQKVIMPMISGVVLMLMPYVVTNLLVMVLIGAVMATVPFIFRF